MESDNESLAMEGVGISISDFLPQYPIIHYTDQNLYPYASSTFNQSIYNKKEFYDLRLTDAETPADEDTGQLLRHQEIVGRFFSFHTPYDQLLLVHEPGTGKTRASIGAVEAIREQGDAFEGALVLTKNRRSFDLFKNELRIKYRYLQYDTMGYDQLGMTERATLDRKIDMENRKFYSYQTFQTFKNTVRTFLKHDGTLQAAKADEFHREYSNRVIVIDEVHNIRWRAEAPKSTGAPRELYNVFFAFVHAVRDCKVLLMSATPMSDTHLEIADVMNLMLPLSDQLPRGAAFNSEYFQNVTNNDDVLARYVVKEERAANLKRYFKGRVSYIRNSSDVVKKFPNVLQLADDSIENEHLVNSQLDDRLAHLSIIPLAMSDIQANGYRQAHNLNHGGVGGAAGEDGDVDERSSFHFASRIASLFVFPDKNWGIPGKEVRGVWGAEGFGQNVTVVDKNSVVMTRRHRLTKSFVNGFGVTEDEKLNNLYRLSCKYSTVIRKIIDNRAHGKKTFVYCELVENGGIVLLALLLNNLFGWTEANGKEREGSHGNRFAFMAAEVGSARIKKLTRRFNNEDNINGGVISLIIGSSAVAEGVTFLDVQCEIVLAPHWNYSETVQAIARGVRFKSHRQLIEQITANTGRVPTPEEHAVEVYQLVACPSAEFNIDMHMYKTSEIKDINIKAVERLIKEAAFDCALTLDRNRVVGVDGTRECDYLPCYYECDGGPFETPPADMDVSTFQLYYRNDAIERVDEIIRVVFQTQFEMDISEIRTGVVVSDFILAAALERFIGQNIPLTNPLGFDSYLRERRGGSIYYLVDDPSVSGETYLYYTQYPIATNHREFKTAFSESVGFKKPLEEATKATTPDQFATAIAFAPLDVQQLIIEKALTAQLVLPVLNTFAAFALHNYRDFYKLIDDKYWVVSWNYLHGKRPGINGTALRCMHQDLPKIWFDCDPDSTVVTMWMQEEQALDALIHDPDTNPAGIYCPYNDRKITKGVPTTSHCIKDVVFGSSTNTFKVCTSTSETEQMRVLIDRLKIPIPPDQVAAFNTEHNGQTVDDLVQLINAAKTGQSKKDKNEKYGYAYLSPREFADVEIEAMNNGLVSRKKASPNDTVIHFLNKRIRLKELEIQGLPDLYDRDNLLRILYWLTHKPKAQNLCKMVEDWCNTNNCSRLNLQCGEHGQTGKK